MNRFAFQLRHVDKRTNARTGLLSTPHGAIETPAFVPVGTQASVKSLTPQELRELGVQLFFVNMYHVYLRPGLDVIKKFGGLHRFMSWDGPIITDSGGFQVFSLGRNKFSSLQEGKNPEDPPQFVKITDDGVRFRSHWDGSSHMLSPEKSMEYQWTLGGDIHIAFDDCTSYPVTHEQARQSLDRTHAWAQRSLAEHIKLNSQHSGPTRLSQALYGSVQGSVYEDLRKESAKFIGAMDFDGIAIGGVSVGESKKEMVYVLDWVVPFLPKSKPRHLLGVGEFDDIFALVERGIDTFDCVQPTRLGRMGHVYTSQTSKVQSQKYLMDITKKLFADDIRPIENRCACYTCQHFSRAYIHHLFRVRELLGYRLATIHNLSFIHRLAHEIRESIEDGTFLELKKKWLYNR